VKQRSLKERALRYAMRWLRPYSNVTLESAWLAGYRAAQRDSKRREGK
jgi:hypothetical protein